MKIIACYKLVPEEQDIKVIPNLPVDTSNVNKKIGQFDLCAVEAAVQIKATQSDCSITALSIGADALAAPKACKDILSRGPDALTLVCDPKLEQALPHQTARVLAAAAKQEGFELILCGDGSGDLYAQQVGLLLGELLQVPCINGVSKILEVANGMVRVERELDDEVEELELSLPAVLAVSADINEPQIPSMKAILAAGKKPVNKLAYAELALEEIPQLVELVSITAPEQKARKQIIIEGDDEGQVVEFVGHIGNVLN
ncbi:MULTISPECIES: putative electron transfer flavoprotein FixA [Shewanella]|uniref:putative electron transfer flavoprotein FixA n=1 Tax=Shewanella algae TaxID=38313 RepID=UPI001AACB0DB|nr:putative electron transfer flavoprotein FixA [Shewanella algae]QTE90477.1 putative electron transfer flavoprotein FixA [Shewanella algae]